MLCVYRFSTFYLPLRLYIFADMADQIQVEVLQHNSDEHEHNVPYHEGKRQMRPSEVEPLSEMPDKCIYVLATKVAEEQGDENAAIAVCLTTTAVFQSPIWEKTSIT